MTTLLAVPNVSEGRRADRLDALARAFDARLLNVHSDVDHHRTVFTLAGQPGELSQAVLAGARQSAASIDLREHAGAHPRVGALDVAPIVYLSEADRGAACAEALVLADLLAEQARLPVFLYGQLAGGRTRAELRRGGSDELARRVAAGELTPDFGPRELDPASGAVLVAARAPLVAFNLELSAPATLADARAIAERIREGGPDGLPAVRAIGLWLSQRGVAQVSINLEDHRATSLAEVLEAVRRHAAVEVAELVGLAPAEAFAGFPADLPVNNRATIEDALGASA